jgi:hypothetical protein
VQFRRLKGSENRYTIRIGDHYRALGTQSADAMRWVWIGTHSDYDQLTHSLSSAAAVTITSPFTTPSPSPSITYHVPPTKTLAPPLYPETGEFGALPFESRIPPRMHASVTRGVRV